MAAGTRATGTRAGPGLPTRATTHLAGARVGRGSGRTPPTLGRGPMPAASGGMSCPHPCHEWMWDVSPPVAKAARPGGPHPAATIAWWRTPQPAAPAASWRGPQPAATAPSWSTLPPGPADRAPHPGLGPLHSYAALRRPTRINDPAGARAADAPHLEDIPAGADTCPSMAMDPQTTRAAEPATPSPANTRYPPPTPRGRRDAADR